MLSIYYTLRYIFALQKSSLSKVHRRSRRHHRQSRRPPEVTYTNLGYKDRVTYASASHEARVTYAGGSHVGYHVSCALI
ncbi:agip6 [Agrotis ipsilon multiple nucleopolyhedrovirus]|uniref:Uncharacterized protein n=1 Tax=Agrotis ipsilon multiple nucleopolyhedrovirus TaxID=208013 RepID=B6D5S0_9ABAC|nr:agip6 [Agrotis ipsilon multiple nucleopolyhedrovirus]ACI28708.1 unknown [Agrotis ipsilon multiple nucleopolyhedrovirus]